MVKELPGLKVPVPLVAHVPPVATVTEPLNAMDVVLAQTVRSTPASDVGPGIIDTLTVLVTGLHPPLLVEVTVKVTVPALISAALGM